jgi:hypothetical protein
MTEATGLRVAKALGVGFSLFGGGGGIAVSQAAVKRVLESPGPLMLKQWSAIYTTGARMFPPISALATASYLYVAYAYANAGDGPQTPYLGYSMAAACCGTAAVPVTFGLVEPVSRQLGKYAAGKDASAKEEEEEARELVRRWGTLNLVRAALLLAAGVIGISLIV